MPVAKDLRAEARESLLAFTKATKPDTATRAGYRASWHHEALCEHLDALARGQIKRLMIFMPPRHGKSELVSRRFPAYLLGRNPHEQVIACSYADSLAAAMNRDVQRIIDSPEYQAIFPQTRLSGKNTRTASKQAWLRNSSEFEIVGHGGYYKSAGVGGGITGRGFSTGLIDDPYKDEKEASSPTVRAGVWEWYTSTFLSREEKDAKIAVTLTRWHMHDLAAQILEADGKDNWVILNFPAIAEGKLHPVDPRKDGMALWPEKFDEATLAKKRKTMPASQWEALYQQRPVPKGGSTFKLEWIKPEHIVDAVPAGMRTLWYWDNAGTKDGGAHTAGALMGVKDGIYYVLQVVKGQWSAAERESVKRAKAEWARSKYKTTTIWNEQEPGSGGKEQFETTARNLVGFTVKADKVTGDKATRAEPLAAQMEVGNIRFFRDPDHDYLGDLFNEMESFPRGRFKDQCDATSGAFAKLCEQPQEVGFEKWR